MTLLLSLGLRFLFRFLVSKSVCEGNERRMFITLAYLLAWSCIILLTGRLFVEKFALVYLFQAKFFSLTSKYFPSQTHSSERSPAYQFPFNFSALFFSLKITARIPSKISLNIFAFFKFLQQLQSFCKIRVLSNSDVVLRESRLWGSEAKQSWKTSVPPQPKTAFRIALSETLALKKLR